MYNAPQPSQSYQYPYMYERLLGKLAESMLPAFHQDGNLPEGIHLAAEDEVFMRFATPSACR